MGKLVYITNVSLDGYIEDARGDFNWSEPSDELFMFITELIRSVGTFVYGRRLYEAMAVWETDPALAAASSLQAEFAAAWQAADKVVYSTTLPAPITERTRIERRFEPEALRELTASQSTDLAVGGADLARTAFRAGVVDECHLFVHPVILGDGKPGLPVDRLALRLLDERRFDNGVVHLHYELLR